MDPEFLPEIGLIFGGLVAGALALRRLAQRQALSALGMAALSVGCISLAVFLGKSSLHASRLESWRSWGKQQSSLALFPAASSDSAGKTRSEPMSLVLGDVVLKTVVAKRYALSIGREPFLELDLRTSGLFVNCVATADSGTYIPITRNTFMHSMPAGIQPTKPDAHSLILQQADRVLFRVTYAGPRRIEVIGTFGCKGRTTPVRMLPNKGIHWDGGGVLPGAIIDLTSQGAGPIDFDDSGLISIQRSMRSRAITE